MTAIFTAIFSFFSSLFTAVLKILTGIIRWIGDNPRLTIAIVVVSIVLFLDHWWGYARGEAKNAATVAELRAHLKVYADANTRQLEKIQQVEASSKQAADQRESFKADTRQKLDTIVAGYEAQVAAERSKTQVVYVTKPGTIVKIPVYLEGEKVVCDQFPHAFVDKVNELVKEANKGMTTKQPEATK